MATLGGSLLGYPVVCGGAAKKPANWHQWGAATFSESKGYVMGIEGIAFQGRGLCTFERQDEKH
jgi:hypothetical protein